MIFIIIITLISLFPKYSYSQSNNINNYLSINEKNELNDPEKIVLNFYRWYIKNIYLKKNVEGPIAKLISNNIYELDATEHIKFIKSAGYFSTSFYKNEIAKFDSCSECLKNTDLKLIADEGFDILDCDCCNFLNSMIWTGGQGEEITTANIIKSEISSNSALVIVVLGLTDDDKYSYPNVTLLKENNKWKIDNITISFNNPK